MMHVHQTGFVQMHHNSPTGDCLRAVPMMQLHQTEMMHVHHFVSA